MCCFPDKYSEYTAKQDGSSPDILTVRLILQLGRFSVLLGSIAVTGCTSNRPFPLIVQCAGRYLLLNFKLKVRHFASWLGLSHSHEQIIQTWQTAALKTPWRHNADSRGADGIVTTGNFSVAEVSYQINISKLHFPLQNGQTTLPTSSKPSTSAHRIAQTSAELALLLIKKPASELSNKTLLTIVNSRARQQEPDGPAQCEHVESLPLAMILLYVSKTVQCVPSLIRSLVLHSGNSCLCGLKLIWWLSTLL